MRCVLAVRIDKMTVPVGTGACEDVHHLLGRRYKIDCRFHKLDYTTVARGRPKLAAQSGVNYIVLTTAHLARHLVELEPTRLGDLSARHLRVALRFCRKDDL